MPLDKDSTFPAPSASTISSMERFYEIQLPKAFKSMLRHYNGARLTGHSVIVADDRERLVEQFLSMVDDPNACPGGEFDIEVVRAQVGDRLPDDVMPIAYLFGGDLLCLDYRITPVPSVAVWDHERTTLQGSPYVRTVCGTFTELLEELELDLPE